MAQRKQCEFHLIRYVPDPVKNEFVNIGVVLRGEGAGSSGAVRFTRDWGRVRCVDPGADTQMLEALEMEVRRRLEREENESRPVLATLEDTLSNAVQITEAKAYLAENYLTGLDELMRLYIDSPKRERPGRRSGRAAIQAVMRASFERAGVWSLMRKQIAVAKYTRPGDPLRLDCGYRNGQVRMFQAVSLETDLEAAKVLCFSSEALRQGVFRIEKAPLELTAVVEPLRGLNSEASRERDFDDLDPDRVAEYRFAVEIMEDHEIRVLTTADLPRVAETARRELHV